MSNNHHCKIGRVRMKDRKIHALPVRPRNEREQELAERLQECADYLQGDISGYVVCAWNRDGSPVVLWNNDRRAVPTMTIPHFIEASARAVIADWVFGND